MKLKCIVMGHTFVPAESHILVRRKCNVCGVEQCRLPMLGAKSKGKWVKTIQ